MNIIEVIPKDDYTLYIKTEDGKAGGGMCGLIWIPRSLRH